MAVPERSMEAQQQLERVLFERGPAGYRGVRVTGSLAETIPFPLRLPVQVEEEGPDTWHDESLRRRAEMLLTELEEAIEQGRDRRAERLKSAFLGVVHADRLARIAATARAEGLRLDPTGAGPVFHRPTVFLRDRLPWCLTPVDEQHHPDLPERARLILEAWEASGKPFDAYYVADEPRGSGPLPCRCLIGVVSADGSTGDWFILERWGC